MAPLISLHNLAFTYPDGHMALRDLSLEVRRGEKLALIGPNGAGKSTLLLHLIGILRGGGQVIVDGLTLSDQTVRRIRAKVGMVFQSPDDQLFSPTVYEDVAFGPLHMGLEPEDVRRRTELALEQVGMSSYAQRMPHHLSLGEKKRIAIATVLSMEPLVLALDEPSAGLDPEARENLIALLQALPQTMIIASHDLDFVQAVCSSAARIQAGQVVERTPISHGHLERAPIA
jgi:cobalt/nickel transport system ATP-binding protein